MAIKIKSQNNYTFLTDTITNVITTAFKSELKIVKNTDGTYDITYKDRVIHDNKDLSFFQDENGVVFTDVAVFENFITSVSGFNYASADGLAVLADDFTSHENDTNNPHDVSKGQIGLGNVPNVDTTTTVNITDSNDKRFVTDNERNKLDNTSGVNTGDETTLSIQTKRPIKTINDISLNGSGNVKIIEGFDFRYYNACNILYLNTANTDYFTNSTNGAGANLTMQADALIRFQISSNSGFVKSVMSNSGYLTLSRGDISYSAKIGVNILSNASQPFIIRIGMMSVSYTDSDISRNAHFKYDYTISPNWLLVSGNGATSTVVDSGIPVVANPGSANTLLRVDYSSLLNMLSYYINDVLVGIITTNIPVTANCGITAFKNSNTGGAVFILNAEYQQIVQKLNASR